MFAELGARTICADTLVYALYERADVKSMLRERFGDGIFDGDGDTTCGPLPDLSPTTRTDSGPSRPSCTTCHAGVEGVRYRGQPGSVNVCEVPLLFEGGLQGSSTLSDDRGPDPTAPGAGLGGAGS